MTIRILVGDVREKLRELPAASVNCVATSPPYYGLRDYGISGQIGLEETPAAYVAVMVEVFREVRRVLRDDGTVWCNLGDSYAANRSYQVPDSKHVDVGNSRGQRAIDYGLKPKDLIGIPRRVAFALQEDGWYLRQDIIWAKPNPMPESIADRCTKAHEYLFLLSKNGRYYYDAKAIAEPRVGDARQPGVSGWASGDTPHNAIAHNQMAGGDKFDNSHARMKAVGRAGPDANSSLSMSDKTRAGDRDDGTRNRRSVWTIASEAFPGAHFACFPPALVEPCILAGCPAGGTVLDPFGGAGTTGLVADRLGRNAILIELNPDYAAMAERRIMDDSPLFAEVGK